jgi:hypothetical protein
VLHSEVGMRRTTTIMVAIGRFTLVYIIEYRWREELTLLSTIGIDLKRHLVMNNSPRWRYRIYLEEELKIIHFWSPIQ